MDSRAWLRRAFEPALRKAGITGVCWHKLRHTAASRRIMAGVDLVSVQRILGHQSIHTTLRYSDLHPKHLRQVFSKADREPGSKPGPAGDEAKVGERQAIDLVVRPAGIEPATLSLEG